MRILIVHNYYQHKGGEDVVFHQEVEALKKDNQVEIITFKNQKGWKGLIQFALYPWNIFAAKKIIKKAKSFKAEVIHIHNLHYAIGPLVIRKLKKEGFKVVMTLHNYRLICPSATLFADGKLFTTSINEDFPLTAIRKKVLDNSFLKTFITAFVYYFHRKIKTWKKVDRFLVLSDFAKKIFQSSYFGINESHFVVKPNFVPRPITAERTKDHHYLYLGRLSKEKGIIQLLQAIRNTNHHLKILGTGPQLEEVLQIVNESNNIEYLGFRSKEEITEELNKSAALIVPSVCYEGMPMTIIESFALGTPVLSNRLGILEQMVIPNQTGFHFDINNNKNILEVLEYFQNLSSQERNRLAVNCKKEYNSKYMEQDNMLLLNKIYKDVVNNN